MLCQYFSASSPNFTVSFFSLLSASNKDAAMRWDAHILSWLLFNDTLNIFECVPNRLMRFSKVWQNSGEKLKPPCMKQRCVCVCVGLIKPFLDFALLYRRAIVWRTPIVEILLNLEPHGSFRIGIPKLFPLCIMVRCFWSPHTVPTSTFDIKLWRKISTIIVCMLMPRSTEFDYIVKRHTILVIRHLDLHSDLDLVVEKYACLVAWCVIRLNLNPESRKITQNVRT